MNDRSRARAAAALAATLCLLSFPACSAKRRPSHSAPYYGVYAGSIREPDTPAARFRVWILALPPDRLHAEILGPAGGARALIDGGDGRVAVTLVDAAECYVGDADADAMRRAIGVRATLAEIVTAFLEGTSATGSATAFRREPAGGPALPNRFEATSDGRTLVLELRGKRRAPEATATLGTGVPPAGLTILPLEQLCCGPWGSGATESGPETR